MAANAYRGEAPLTIGPFDLVIGVEFGGLAKYASMTGMDDANAVMRSLVSFSPKHAAAALECFTLSGDWESARDHLTMAVQSAWTEAFANALVSHIDKGKAALSQKATASPKS